MAEFYPVMTALTFNALDLLTGIVAGIKNKDIQSSKLRDGLFKKVGFVLTYFVAWLVDTHGADIGFQISVSILPIVILYSCTTELVSILENICKINPDFLPEKMLEMFNIKKDGDEG